MRKYETNMWKLIAAVDVLLDVEQFSTDDIEQGEITKKEILEYHDTTDLIKTLVLKILKLKTNSDD
jgi:hypothetical protein